jgi:hypothetical protein
MEKPMKNIIFTLSLLTIVSTNVLYPMDSLYHPTNHSYSMDRPYSKEHAAAVLQSLYAYPCPFKSCKEAFNFKPNVYTHINQCHIGDNAPVFSEVELQEGYCVNIESEFQEEYCMDIETTPSPYHFGNTTSSTDSITEEETSYDSDLEGIVTELFEMEESDSETEILEIEENITPGFFGNVPVVELLTKIRQSNNNNNNNNNNDGNEYNTSTAITHNTQPQIPCRVPHGFNQEIYANDDTVSEKENSSDAEEFEVEGYSSDSEDQAPLRKKIPSTHPLRKQTHPLLKKRVAQSVTNKTHKKFPCTFEGCDMSFARKDHLSRHECTHTGEKPFACETCNKAFARAYDLNRHIGTQHSQIKKKSKHSQTKK